MKKLPFVSIITVNYNGKRFLKDCFDSLYNLNYPQERFEIFMVDNGSNDGSLEFVKEKYPQIEVVQNDVNNYARANNLGIKASEGKYVALINNDAKVDSNWLIELIKLITKDNSIGAVGSKILFMDGRIQSVGHEEHSAFYWVDRGCYEEDRGQYNQVAEVSSICGCSVLYRKKCLEDAGFLDEDFNMYMEDVDMSIRCREKGWRLVYVPTSLIYHMHHGTVQNDSALFHSERNRLMLLAKHYPKELNNALLGKGYFTVRRDIKEHAGLYKILADVVVKMIKHQKIKIVKEVLDGLFTELKKISNFENKILIDKVIQFLKSIEAQQMAIREKDMHINDLNKEIENRDEALKDKDYYINALNLDIKKRDETLKEKNSYIVNLNIEMKNKQRELTDIYNSTVFTVIVRPLWAVLWKIKQAIKHMRHSKSAVSVSREFKNSHVEYANVSRSNQKCTLGKTGICTIISKNYLSYARVLANSFLQYNKGDVFVLLTDSIDGYFDPKREKFILVEINDIKDRIKNFEAFCFQYNATELNTAVKPFFIEFLLEKYRLKKLVFFDPDILITQNLDGLFRLLDDYSIVLIPHVTRPFKDNQKPAEIEILRSGVYNLGFIALTNKEITNRLIRWWKERLSYYCKIDVQKGLFVDQKWIDLIP